MPKPHQMFFQGPEGGVPGFHAERRGVKANPDKCQVVISMRIPTNIKEVQQHTGRSIDLSCFLSWTIDNSLTFFVALKKKMRFESTPECEEAFTKVNNFLTSPPILTHPRDGSPLLLNLSVIDQAMSLVLVHEIYKAYKLVYFVRQVFMGTKECYQKIEKLALVIIVSACKLWPNFQGHKILVKTNYLVCQVSKKPDLDGRWYPGKLNSRNTTSISS